MQLKRDHMTDQERKVLRTICADNLDAARILHGFLQFSAQNRKRIFMYLLKKGIFGKFLVDMFHDYDHSCLQLGNEILKRERGLMKSRLILKDLET